MKRRMKQIRNKNLIYGVFSRYLAWCGIIVYNDEFLGKKAS
jgi:hypothetical protein